MLKEKIYLILGIGTDIGKTFCVEKLCKNLLNVTAIKPIVSGFLDDDLDSDPAKILTALGRKINKNNLDEISPWRFTEAVSPHFAGEIDYSELKKFSLDKIAAAKKQNSFLFIEAAGGVMSPITYQKTFLDLARDLQIAVLLVSSNYLGSISHTLSAVEVLKKNDVLIEKIILNEKNPSRTKTEDIVKTLENFTKIEVVTTQKLT